MFFIYNNLGLIFLFSLIFSLFWMDYKYEIYENIRTKCSFRIFCITFQRVAQFLISSLFFTEGSFHFCIPFGNSYQSKRTNIQKKHKDYPNMIYWLKFSILFRYISINWNNDQSTNKVQNNNNQYFTSRKINKLL